MLDLVDVTCVYLGGNSYGLAFAYQFYISFCPHVDSKMVVVVFDGLNDVVTNETGWEYACC